MRRRPHVLVIGLVGKDTSTDVLHHDANDHTDDAEPRARTRLFKRLPIAGPSTFLMAQTKNREDEQYSAADVGNVCVRIKNGFNRCIGDRTSYEGDCTAGTSIHIIVSGQYGVFSGNCQQWVFENQDLVRPMNDGSVLRVEGPKGLLFPETWVGICLYNVL